MNIEQKLKKIFEYGSETILSCPLEQANNTMRKEWIEIFWYAADTIWQHHYNDSVRCQHPGEQPERRCSFCGHLFEAEEDE